MKKRKTPCILYMSSFPPRECGIATFTRRLTNSIDKEYNPEIKSKILAINSNGTSMYNYPRKVIMQINETEIEDYIDRANEINKSADIKLVNIQHEYGLFGGEQGEFLVPFLELLKKPIVITMHTVLPHPGEKMKNIGRVISEKVNGVIVMNGQAKEILHQHYGVKLNKISVIHHGVFNVAFPSKTKFKQKLNLSGRTVLSTFGMISRDKGIEYAIEALPKIIKKHPDVLYLIIGATHPQVRKNEGEKYRNKLKRLIVKHSLKNHVKFYNKYLSEKEVTEFLRATDIYVYPMLSKNQASSGSLSDAMSCACPTIATPSQYAKSIINHERGILVRFRSSKDIEKALLEMLNDKTMRKEMTKNAYFYTRKMTWQNVALSYFNLFNHSAKIIPRRRDAWPAIKLDYIKNLTDEFGMIQFANHTKPDKHSGYCLDDNTRALLGCVMWYEKKKIKSTLNLIKKYLNFIKFCQKKDGQFHNFVSHQHTFNDLGQSEDSFGRAIWALGYTLKCERLNDDTRMQIRLTLKKTISRVDNLQSPRAIAFTIIGLYHIFNTEVNNFLPELRDNILNRIKLLSDRLIAYYQKQLKTNNSQEKWHWFENCFTYSNFKLPEALFLAYKTTKNKKYKKVAETTMNFLINITFEKENYFSPIGQDGWYFRNGKRAYFDQQPEDASSAVEGLSSAYAITKKKDYKNKAKLALQWFLGKNHLKQMVYDEATGGCFDGLGKYSLNFNQGAESSVSYFLARLAIENINTKKRN
ncbi:MAG: glycosyltransferase family 4 protein [Patescibacteria group bacterium]|nr:glycosyltransferase family 4 protein [Patescibacteria group bacterium]